jgi:hypothetical protein
MSDWMEEGPLERSGLRGIVEARAYLGDLRVVAARGGAEVVDRAWGKPELVFDEGHYLFTGYGASLCFAGKSDDALPAFAVELDGYVRARGDARRLGARGFSTAGERHQSGRRGDYRADPKVRAMAGDHRLLRESFVRNEDTENPSKKSTTPKSTNTPHPTLLPGVRRLRKFVKLLPQERLRRDRMPVSEPDLIR